MAVQQIVDCGQGNSAAQVRIERLLDLPDNQNAALGCFFEERSQESGFFLPAHVFMPSAARFSLVQIRRACQADEPVAQLTDPSFGYSGDHGHLFQGKTKLQRQDDCLGLAELCHCVRLFQCLPGRNKNLLSSCWTCHLPTSCKMSILYH